MQQESTAIFLSIREQSHYIAFGCYYGFHQKTGNTTICPIKGDDLTIEFDTQNTQNLSYYVYAA